ncbi:MAG TPA: PASTA domain-containing protein [Bryobacteraceae bacterium]
MSEHARAQSPPVYNPDVPSYVITDLGVLPGVVHNPQTGVDLRDDASEAYAISASGVVVGQSGHRSYSGDSFSLSWDSERAFLWQPDSPNKPTGSLKELSGPVRSKCSGILSFSAAFDITPVAPVDIAVGFSTIEPKCNPRNGIFDTAVQFGKDTIDLGAVLPIRNFSYALGVNDINQAVGFVKVPVAVNDKWEAWIIDGQAVHQLGYLPGFPSSKATRINDQGFVIGIGWDPNDLSSPQPEFPFIGGIFGTFGLSAEHGFRHAGTGPLMASDDIGSLGGVITVPTGINQAGVVVGYSELRSTAYHGFIDDGGLKDLGSLILFGSSAASAINTSGDVVGFSDTATGAQHAVLWIKGDPNRIVDLNDYVDPALGWTLITANAINDHGQIAGTGILKGEEHAFLLTDAVCYKYGGDSDGDGLCDDWERYGVQVQAANGTTNFLNLPAMGANPTHKDIFVQTDYMVAPDHSHKLKRYAPDLLMDAFRNAPVMNPDNKEGINLHVDCGRDCVMNAETGETWGDFSRAKAVKHVDVLGVEDLNGTKPLYNWYDFDQIKSANFPPERKIAFHYSVFAHSIPPFEGTQLGGISRSEQESDFIVSLGSFRDRRGTEWDQAETFMHELGHNLGLLHGGADDINFKPNHLSIMSYLFPAGLWKDGLYSKLDYSRFDLPTLNENQLDETVGLNGGTELDSYGTAFYCWGATIPTLVEKVNSPIDWNCNGRSGDKNVAAEISGAISNGIVNSTLSDGGSGYAPGDTFVVVGPLEDSVWARGRVLTVNRGLVQTYSLTSSGTHYKLGYAATARTSGRGAGLTINITAVTPESPLEELHAYNEWNRLVFTGGAVGGLSLNRILPAETPIPQELTPEMAAAVQAPFAVAVDAPGIMQVAAGARLNTSFTITNLGSRADTYDLAYNRTADWWDLSGVPGMLSLLPGQSQQIVVPGIVPVSTSAGADGHLTVKATSRASQPHQVIEDSDDVEILVPSQLPVASVPDVVGQTQMAATTAITGAGFALGSVTTQPSADLPAGLVMSQNPAAGTLVAFGSKVDLALSSGAPISSVPNVVGQTQTAATAAIVSAGLIVGAITTEPSATVPTGAVISQAPVASTKVPSGSAVNLVLSSGPSGLTVRILDVSGLEYSAAVTALKSAGLTVDPFAAQAAQSSNTVPASHVIAQDPAAGLTVAGGAIVKLVVSNGSRFVTVPNIVGQQQNAAVLALRALSLNSPDPTIQYSSTVPAGSIISQAPDAGTSAARGSTVSLAVSSGVPVSVPNVVGLTEPAGFSTLEGFGLHVGETSQASRTIPAQTIISQIPDPGTQVSQGATINLVVSSGPPVLVSVPNVVGLNEKNLQNAVTAAQLVIGSMSQQFSVTTQEGTIVSQSPAAGTSVEVGSRMDLTVSSFAPTNTISTVAGRNPLPSPDFLGDGGPATLASMGPLGIAVAATGDLYVSDPYHETVRRVDTNGTITTVAGTTGTGGTNATLVSLGDGGAATRGVLIRPFGIVSTPGGDLFVADESACRVRRISAAGVISAITGRNPYTGPDSNGKTAVACGLGGSGTYLFPGIHGFTGDDGPATEALLGSPRYLTVGPEGSIYVSDQLFNRVRRIDPSGVISTYAGNGAPGHSETGVLAFGGDGGPAISAMLDWPGALAFSDDGSLYIADTNNARVRRVDPAGIITTVAGNGVHGYSGDGGLATDASLNFAYGSGLAVSRDGLLYVAEGGNNVIRRINTDGTICTVVGDGNAGYFGDGGVALSAQLNGPGALAFGGDGSLYITDVFNNVIRRVTPPIHCVSPAAPKVPDVIGKVQDAASALIKKAGLITGTVTSQPSDSVPAGAVISQNPVGGTIVGIGSSVDLVLSSGSASVVNGACGSSNGRSFVNAPTAGLCTAGAPSAVTGTGPWNWTCTGSNGGTTASCSANRRAKCDLNADGKIDANDINAILSGRGEHRPGDPRDIDGDGWITVDDARACVLKCTNPNCAP